MTEPSYTELRKLEVAIANHGGEFKRRFDALMSKEAARSHDNYKRVLVYCWKTLNWRPTLLDTQVYIAAKKG